MDEVEALLAEQVAYYRAHAPDYDNEYLGQPWDRCLDELPITGDVLELACGTGHWTPLLVARARSVTAVDVAPEVLALARQRVRGLPVEFIQVDVFGWRPPRRYDTVFFAFWLTHVPPARFTTFWSVVGAALAPGGRPAFSTAAPVTVSRNACCSTRQHPPCGAAFAMAASTGWSRCSTRLPSLPPGSPSWAGRQTSARQATPC